jgi:hypothetical protein
LMQGKRELVLHVPHEVVNQGYVRGPEDGPKRRQCGQRRVSIHVLLRGPDGRQKAVRGL